MPNLKPFANTSNLNFFFFQNGILNQNREWRNRRCWPTATTLHRRTWTPCSSWHWITPLSKLPPPRPSTPCSDHLDRPCREDCRQDWAAITWLLRVRRLASPTWAPTTPPLPPPPPPLTDSSAGQKSTPSTKDHHPSILWLLPGTIQCLSLPYKVDVSNQSDRIQNSIWCDEYDGEE